jgi:hypothetical protein
MEDCEELSCVQAKREEGDCEEEGRRGTSVIRDVCD